MGEYLLKREEETQGVKSLSHQELVGRLLLSPFRGSRTAL